MTAEYIPQDVDDTEAIQLVREHEDNDEYIPEDKGNGEEADDKYEIPKDELSHISTLTPPKQAVYRMEQLSKNQNQDYRYRFASVMNHAMKNVSLNIGLN